MKSVKRYMLKLRQNLFHKGEAFALEGGITFGPGSDPKGSFYTNPKVSICWYQPESVVLMEDSGKERGRVRGWLSKLGVARKSA